MDQVKGITALSTILNWACCGPDLQSGDLGCTSRPQQEHVKRSCIPHPQKIWAPAALSKRGKSPGAPWRNAHIWLSLCQFMILWGMVKPPLNVEVFSPFVLKPLTLGLAGHRDQLERLLSSDRNLNLPARQQRRQSNGQFIGAILHKLHPSCISQFPIEP